MSFNSKLRFEIANWLKEGLITTETANILLRRYPDKKRSMTQTLALLGSVLLGTGVILFFAANWEVMPRLLKISVVMLSFTLSYFVGYYLRYKKGTYPKVGYALICLGSILYGAAIWLIAQIFHIEAEAGMGFFMWFLGVIPVAYYFSSSINLTLALVNLAAWFLAGHYPLGWAYVVFPLLLLAAIFPLTILKRDKFNFVLAIIAAYIWFIPLGVKMSGVRFSFQLGMVSLLLLSLILYQLVLVLRNKSFFAENFLLSLSLMGLFASLASFTFHDFLDNFNDSFQLEYFPILLIVSLVVLLVLKIKSKRITKEDLPLALLYLCLFLFLPNLSNNSFLLILNNVLLFVFALISIYYGYLIRRPIIFNLSIVLFAAAIVIKYFDYFFALMPRSMFFMSGGILLLLGSFLLEHKRRSLLQTMERGE